MWQCVCLSFHCMPNFSDMIQPLDALSTLICLICRYLVKFGRQEEHPACKNWVVGCCCGYLSGAIVCSLFAYGPTDATATPNPIVSCLIEIQTVLHFWYRLTQVVQEKRPLNGCSSVVVSQGIAPAVNWTCWCAGRPMFVCTISVCPCCAGSYLLLVSSLISLAHTVQTWPGWWGAVSLPPLVGDWCWWAIRCWCVICLEQDADCLHMAQLMSLHLKNPVISCHI